MVTQYQEEIERAIDETLDYLCKKFKDKTLLAGFEIFAVEMRGAAMRIPAHRPNRNAGRFNKGQYIGPYKEKKK